MTKEDVPFEPQFGDMTREQLLDIARRYHWMLAEVEAFAPDSEAEPAGDMLEIDLIERDEVDNTYRLFYATRHTADEFEESGVARYPYLIGEVR